MINVCSFCTKIFYALKITWNQTSSWKIPNASKYKSIWWKFRKMNVIVSSSNPICVQKRSRYHYYLVCCSKSKTDLQQRVCISLVLHRVRTSTSRTREECWRRRPQRLLVGFSPQISHQYPKSYRGRKVRATSSTTRFWKQHLTHKIQQLTLTMYC